MSPLMKQRRRQWFVGRIVMRDRKVTHNTVDARHRSENRCKASWYESTRTLVNDRWSEAETMMSILKDLLMSTSDVSRQVAESGSCTSDLSQVAESGSCFYHKDNCCRARLSQRSARCRTTAKLASRHKSKLTTKVVDFYSKEQSA